MRISYPISAAALALCLATSATAQQRSDVTLRVGAFGGPFAEALQKYTADLFTHYTGVKIQFTYANPSDFLAQLIASRGREPPYDVVCMDDDVEAQAVQAGVLQKTDPAIVTNLRYLYPEAQGQGYGPTLFIYSFGIAYNKEKLAAAGIPAPTSWNDLWDPRLAGHVAIPDISNVLGRDLIIKIARLNGGGETDLGPAVAKLAAIKVHSYYIGSSTVQAQLESGDVWVAPWTNMRSWGMIDRGLPIGFVIPKEGGVGNTDKADVVARTPHPKEAQMFVNFMIDPFSELGMAKLLPDAPSNSLLGPVIAADPEMAKKIPITAADRARLYFPDWAAFNAKMPEVTAEWNRSIHR